MRLSGIDRMYVLRKMMVGMGTADVRGEVVTKRYRKVSAWRDCVPDLS